MVQMRSAWSITKLPLRVPFTLVTLAALVLRAWRTDTIEAGLSHHVLARAGFAPEDLFEFGWHRLFSSALFTHGPLEFWAAVLMILFAVGVVERVAGTAIAAITFWGVHLLTLIAESVFVALPLKLAGLDVGAQIASLRDVGPSAGYVGALGLLCALLPKPWRYVAAGIVISILLYAMLGPDEEHLSTAAVLSAGIAHLIAFPLGWFSLSLWRRLRRRSNWSIDTTRTIATIGPRVRTRATGVVDQCVAVASSIRPRARSSS